MKHEISEAYQVLSLPEDGIRAGSRNVVFHSKLDNW